MISLIDLLPRPRKHKADMIEPFLHQFPAGVVIDPLHLPIIPKQFDLNPILIHYLSAAAFIHSILIHISNPQFFLGDLWVYFFFAVEGDELGGYFTEVADGLLFGVEEE